MTMDDVHRMREEVMAETGKPPTEIRMTFQQYCDLRAELAASRQFFELRITPPFNKPEILDMTIIIIEDYHNDY